MDRPPEGADRRFGKYQLIAHIASGGMAEIYIASFEALAGFEKIIVVKRMLPRLQEDKHYVEMFLDEARLTAQLNHPNVVQIFDMGEIEGRYFIAMEYLAGESLAAVLRTLRKARQRLTPPLAAGIVMQAAEGLHHAHTLKGRDGKPLGLVHRDIGPQNIFVLYDGGVKVVDFGVAKASERSTHTRTGVIKGKIGYMSPEQIQSQDLDARSDIFVLGIVLWECLTCRKLFRGEGEYNVMRAICEGNVTSPRSVNEKVPERLEAITLKAMAQDRDQRYQSAADLRGELAAYLRESAAEADTVAIGSLMKHLFAESMLRKEQLIKSASEAEGSQAEAYIAAWREQSEGHTPSVPHSTPTPASAESPAAPAAAPSAFSSARSLVSTLEVDRGGAAEHGIEPTVLAAAPGPLSGPRRPIAIGGAAVLLLGLLVFATVRLAAPGEPAPDAGAIPVAIAEIDQVAPDAGVRAEVTEERDAGGRPAEATKERDAGGRPARDAARGKGGQRDAGGRPTPSAVAVSADAAHPNREGAQSGSAPDSGHAEPDSTTPPNTEEETRSRADVGKRKKRDRPSGAAKKPTGRGTLRLKTTPWAIIYYQGKRVGESPIIDAELPAGTLRLRAVNKEAGIDTWISVEIKPGERTSEKVDLRR